MLLHSCVTHARDALGCHLKWMLTLVSCYPQVLRLWEALWSGHLMPHFHLYVAAGVLGLHRRAFMKVRACRAALPNSVQDNGYWKRALSCRRGAARGVLLTPPDLPVCCCAGSHGLRRPAALGHGVLPPAGRALPGKSMFD